MFAGSELFLPPVAGLQNFPSCVALDSTGLVPASANELANSAARRSRDFDRAECMGV
ncbi:MAG: hypothetical protein QM719_01975 [Thermomonas sp.]